jgi:D-lactate dehydrogenase
MDIFFYEAFDEETRALKKHLPPGLEAGFTRETIQEYASDQPPADFISIRTQSVLPCAWAEKLSAILSRSTGYNHLQRYVEECHFRRPCGYLPLYCHRAVAEQAILLAMALMRNLPAQIAHFYEFNRDGITGLECKKKTMVVVGVGNIGYEVVRIARGLGMHVLGVDIVEKHPDVRYVTIENALPLADVIVSAMNLTSDNEGYFNYERFKKTKRGLIFVNVSRGEISPSLHLLRLMREGRLGGIGLDVFCNESELAVNLRAASVSNDEEVQATLELSRHSNVILTPHNAFNTQEAVDRKARHSVRQVLDFLEHGRFVWTVPCPPDL